MKAKLNKLNIISVVKYFFSNKRFCIEKEAIPSFVGRWFDAALI